jgi:hypothetical protein
MNRHFEPLQSVTHRNLLRITYKNPKVTEIKQKQYWWSLFQVIIETHFEIHFNIIPLSIPNSTNGLFLSNFRIKIFCRHFSSFLEAAALTVHKLIVFIELEATSAKSQQITVALEHTLL